MADTPTVPPVNNSASPAGTGNQSDTPRLFTQEEVNALVGSTRIQERDKAQQRVTTEYGDLDTLVAKAKRFDDLEAASLSETEKLKREVEAAKLREAEAARKVADAERATLRLKVGQLKGLPTLLAERLQGDTEDEMAADADRLLAEIGQTAKPKPPNLDAAAGAGGGAGSRRAALTLEQEEALASAQKVDPKMTREKYTARLHQLQGGG